MRGVNGETCFNCDSAKKSPATSLGRWLPPWQDERYVAKLKTKAAAD